MALTGDIYVTKGRCRCHAMTATLVLSRPPGVITPRACQCAFCRDHDAVTFADPGGHLTIEATSPDYAEYRFWPGGATTLHCRRCGTYVAVLFAGDEGLTGSINIRGLGIANLTALPALLVDDERETPEVKRARRLAGYMPVELINIREPEPACPASGPA